MNYQCIEAGLGKPYVAATRECQLRGAPHGQLPHGAGCGQALHVHVARIKRLKTLTVLQEVVLTAIGSLGSGSVSSTIEVTTTLLAHHATVKSNAIPRAIQQLHRKGLLMAEGTNWTLTRKAGKYLD